MIIRFLNKHLSVYAFNPVELPDFSVLTGLNGAGKSHLLAALRQGSVKIDGLSAADIILFSNSNFRIGGEDEYTGQQVASEAQGAWSYFSQQMLQHASTQIDGIPLPHPYNENPESIESIIWKLDRFIDNQYQMRQQPIIASITETVRKLNRSLKNIDEKSFVRAFRPFEIDTGALPKAIGKIFVDYRQKQIMNSLIKVENETLGLDETWLDTTEFEKIHGRAPWKVINEILKNFSSVQYEVTSPERIRFHEKFKLYLQSTTDQTVRIDFEDLSSGEKVLMALVALVYRQSLSNSFPKVVLLDEIDASLHPSMTRGMLSVLTDVFTSRGTKVIMVTHSPSTIALVPEESIFVVNRTGDNKIEKRTRSDALSILTEGFATLEEGLVLFDRSTLTDLSIISEGFNTEYIKSAIDHFNIQNVNVVDNLAGVSGKNSMRTLFEFFSRMQHRSKILFVWDCDASEMRNLVATPTTIPFVFDHNAENTLVKNGVENLLPLEICRNFRRVTKVSSRFEDKEIETFDGDKRGLERFVKERNSPADFQKFGPLMDLIRHLQRRPNSHSEPISPN